MMVFEVELEITCKHGCGSLAIGVLVTNDREMSLMQVLVLHVFAGFLLPPIKLQ